MNSLVGHGDGGVEPPLGVDRFIAVLANPGLPNGASTSLDVHEGEHNVTRLFQWTPQPGQEGITYMVSNSNPSYVPLARCSLRAFVRVRAGTDL